MKDSLYNENVCLASEYKNYNGGRMGTAFITLSDFASRFGNPHAIEEDFADDKVTAAWTIDTPRGVVEVGDYWWNPKDQLSIRSSNYKAMLWAVKWLRVHGVKASFSNGK